VAKVAESFSILNTPHFNYLPKLQAPPVLKIHFNPSFNQTQKLQRTVTLESIYLFLSLKITISFFAHSCPIKTKSIFVFHRNFEKINFSIWIKKYNFHSFIRFT